MGLTVYPSQDGIGGGAPAWVASEPTPLYAVRTYLDSLFINETGTNTATAPPADATNWKEIGGTKPGFNSVASIAARDLLTVPRGDYAIIADNGEGSKAIHVYNGAAWEEIHVITTF